MSYKMQAKCPLKPVLAAFEQQSASKLPGLLHLSTVRTAVYLLAVTVDLARGDCQRPGVQGLEQVREIAGSWLFHRCC